MKLRRNTDKPSEQNSPSQTAESLLEQLERERWALATERERFEAQRAAWQESMSAQDAQEASEVLNRIAQQQARLDAQRREFEEARAAVATRQAELDAMQLNLDQREAELEQQRREIAKIRQEMAKVREAAERPAESVQARQTSQQAERLAELYRQQQAEIDAERETLLALQEHVRVERAALSETLQGIEEDKAQIKHRSEALAEHADQLERQAQQLAQEREQLATERARLTDDQAEFEPKRAELSNQAERIERARHDLQGQRDRLVAQQEQLEEQRASLEAEQAALASRSEGIEKQRQALAAQREKLVARQQELDAEHEELRQTGERLKREAEAQRSELQEKIDQFELQLTQVTKRGRHLEERHRELDERQRTLEESERQAREEQARRRADLDARQRALDERNGQMEAEVRQAAAALEASRQREAELAERLRAEVEAAEARKDADEQTAVDVQARLALQAEQLEADRMRLDEERQEAAREVAGERKVLEQQREELAKALADLARREDQMAAQLEAIEAARQDKPIAQPEPIVIETGGFSLVRALIASLLLAVVSVVAILSWVGVRQEVKGNISVTSVADPEQALAQNAALLSTPTLIRAAARNLSADVSPDDIAKMVGPGGEIEVTTVPEYREIRLRAVTTDAKRAQLVIDALGNALVDQIMSRATSSQPSVELKRLEDDVARTGRDLDEARAALSHLKQVAEGAKPPDPTVVQLESQRKAAQVQWAQAKQDRLAAEKNLAGFSVKPVSAQVDAATLEKIIKEDEQRRQLQERLGGQTRQLRTLLVEGLTETSKAMASMDATVESFEAEVAGLLKKDWAEDVTAAVEQIRLQLSTCAKQIAVASKSWTALLEALHRPKGAADDEALLADQKKAEGLHASLVDGIRKSSTEIYKHLQLIVRSGAQDSAQRNAVYAALKSRAQALTISLQDFSNAGSQGVFPMFNPSLDSCLQAVRQYRQGIENREKEITAEITTRTQNLASESQGQRLAQLRSALAEKVALEDRALAELLALGDAVIQAQKQQKRCDDAQREVKLADERVKQAQQRKARAETRLSDFRSRAGSMPAADRKDRARFTGAFTEPGLANQDELLRQAGGTALFVFAMTWAVTWLVSGGRGRTRRR